MKFKLKDFKWFVSIMILLIISVLLTFAVEIMAAVWKNEIILGIAAGMDIGMKIITLILAIFGLTIIFHEMEESEKK